LTEPLRLMFYDDTCRRSKFGVGLTHSWIAGAHLYSVTRKFHATFAARDWQQALAWLASYEDHRPIAEIQYWGHGKWGRVLIDGEPLTAEALDAHHALRPRLEAIRERLQGPGALWWFRTCETFGAQIGHDFARRWSDFFGCRAAGHTYIIGPLQSGLHAVEPGQMPAWSTFEGIAEGTPERPSRALWSIPGAPNTISFLRPTLPAWAVNRA